MHAEPSCSAFRAISSIRKGEWQKFQVKHALCFRFKQLGFKACWIIFVGFSSPLCNRIVLLLKKSRHNIFFPTSSYRFSTPHMREELSFRTTGKALAISTPHMREELRAPHNLLQPFGYTGLFRLRNTVFLYFITKNKKSVYCSFVETEFLCKVSLTSAALSPRLTPILAMGLLVLATFKGSPWLN